MSAGLASVAEVVSARSQTDRRITYLPCLDGLRAIAVLMVLGVHFPAIDGLVAFNLVHSADQTLRGGYLGVDLFFVLSGFLITRILLRQRIRQGSFSLRVFYGRRALRTAPIYFLCVLVCTQLTTMNWQEFVSLLFYGMNYYQPLTQLPHYMEHTWSLAVEEQFYLIWPLVLAWIPLRRGQVVTGLLVPALALLTALSIASVATGQVASDLIYMSTPTRMMSLSLGAFIAFREQQGRPLSVWSCVVAVGVGALVLVSNELGRREGVIPTGGYYWSIATAGFAGISFGVVAALVFGRGPLMHLVQHLLATAPMRLIGRVSYGLYLYHMVILFALGINPARVGPEGVSSGRAMVALALTFGIAFASYYLIEQPILSLKDRLRRNLDGSVSFGRARSTAPSGG